MIYVSLLAWPSFGLRKAANIVFEKKFKEVKVGDFWRRREGIIGLSTILVIVGLFWTLNHFFG
jgi:hypothetical protein